MESESLEISETFGLCKLNSDSRVMFQNQTSKKICGEKQDETCTTCSDNLIPSESKETLGIFTNKKIKINDTLCEATLLKEAHKSAVILHPKTTQNDRLVFLENYALTPREKEVGMLLLEGKNNVEIMNALFISKATLKTYVNILYKKIPNLKKQRNVS